MFDVGLFKFGREERYINFNNANFIYNVVVFYEKDILKYLELV